MILLCPFSFAPFSSFVETFLARRFILSYSLFFFLPKIPFFSKARLGDYLLVFWVFLLSAHSAELAFILGILAASGACGHGGAGVLGQIPVGALERHSQSQEPDHSSSCYLSCWDIRWKWNNRWNRIRLVIFFSALKLLVCCLQTVNLIVNPLWIISLFSLTAFRILSF